VDVVDPLGHHGQVSATEPRMRIGLNLI
jgi:hypothetical protein